MTAPAQHRPLSVGLIGAGRIVRTGVLPAYSIGGVPVAAICSKSGTSARELAGQWTGPGPIRVRETPAELAADPGVELIEVATPPHDRRDMLRELITYGKPLFVHKPLAYDLGDARAIVADAEAAGVPIAVSHNARWWPPQRVLGEWLEHGELGDVVHLANVHHFGEDICTWYTDRADYIFVEHGIHFLDLARRHLGEPVAVAARQARVPGQQARCPLAYTIMLRFATPVLASLTLYNATRTPAAWDCHWFVNGSRADAHVTFTTATLHRPDGETVTRAPEGGWIPDGLLAAYTAYAEALHYRQEPPHSGADHLRTLALATAAAQSAGADGEWTEVPPPGAPERAR